VDERQMNEQQAGGVSEIVELVLREARTRSRRMPSVTSIYSVLMDVDKEIIRIMTQIGEEERKEKNENVTTS